MEVGTPLFGLNNNTVCVSGQVNGMTSSKGKARWLFPRVGVSLLFDYCRLPLTNIDRHSFFYFFTIFKLLLFLFRLYN
jgi:hypothetical protein